MKKRNQEVADIINQGETSSKKRKVKEFAERMAIIVAVSLVMALMVRLSGLGELENASDFFSGSVMLQILILTAIMAILLSTLYFYSIYVRKDLDGKERKKLVPVLSISVLITFGLAILFSRLINLYVAPLILCSLLVAMLIDKRVGIVTNILVSQAFFLAYLVIFGEEKVVESSAALITSMVSAIFLIVYFGKSHCTRMRFVGIGVIVGVCTAVIPMLINLIINPNDVYTILISGLWSFVSVVLSVALFMIFLPLMEYIFRISTPFRLTELCSLSSPLLKELAQKAPGTFNHSVAVGNLAEICADAIGESPELAKACSYYHDVGKLANSEWFVENQQGYNPHDDVIPEVSVSMIVSHVKEGYDMIKRERLPDIIADVVVEHHGTTPVNYFLYKAQGFTEDDVDRKEFCYAGPKPQTKIAAIIMIADTVEAAGRAVASQLTTPESIRSFVHKMIKDKVDLDQFDECGLTFKDLKIIEDTLVKAVPSLYHARIRYNNNPKEENK